MNKIFTILILLFVPVSSIAWSQDTPEEIAKIRRDRERLIDLVISLQKDFGGALRDYAKLQDDYAKLLKKKDAPDNLAKVADLQKKLNKALKQLKDQKPDPKAARAQEQLKKDLVNLRNELQRERQDLLIARAQVLRLKELEKKNKDLDSKKAMDAKTAGELKALRTERDNLLGKLKSNMTAVQKAEHARDALAKQLDVVTKENASLKKKVETQAARIAELSKIEAEHQKALTAAENLKNENERLTALMAEREKQLANLREHLAAEVKRTLDIPVLIQARDELRKKLEKANKSTGALSKENKMLVSRKAELEEQIATTEKSIAEMRKQLEQNKAAMASATELATQNESLKADKVKLEKTVEMAKAELVRAKGARNRLEAQLAETQKIADSAAKLKTMNEALLEEQNLLNDRLKNTEATLAASNKLTEELQISMRVLAKQKEELTKTIASNEAEIKKLKTAANMKPEPGGSITKLEEEKKALADQLAKREEDLKKTRAELGRLQIAASVAQKNLVSLKRTQAKIDPVRYNLGGTKVATQQSRVLAQVQDVLKNFPHAKFEIVGHTCDLGNADTNLKLSRQRAKSLYDFLISKGVSSKLLTHRGVGQAEPMVPNNSEANRRLNRRVVVEILD